MRKTTRIEVRLGLEVQSCIEGRGVAVGLFNSGAWTKAGIVFAKVMSGLADVFVRLRELSISVEENGQPAAWLTHYIGMVEAEMTIIPRYQQMIETYQDKPDNPSTQDNATVCA